MHLLRDGVMAPVSTNMIGITLIRLTLSRSTSELTGLTKFVTAGSLVLDHAAGYPREPKSTVLSSYTRPVQHGGSLTLGAFLVSVQYGAGMLQFP